jgi:hypothetical protein
MAVATGQRDRLRRLDGVELEALGARLERAPFQPEGGAYAGDRHG